MGEAERAAFLEKLHAADPQAWELLRREVPAAISQMANDGYCVAAGTLEAGTNGAAVVVDTPDGPHTYALGCAAPSTPWICRDSSKRSSWICSPSRAGLSRTQQCKGGMIMVRTRQVTPAAPRDDAQVDSLRRGLEVLRLFDLRHRKLTLADIARKLDLSRPTTEKLVQTLQSQHFLQATGNDSYEPHIACLTIGRAAKKGLAVAQAARPLMRELSERFGVHVTLSARDRLHMLVVEHCVPPAGCSLA